MIVVSNLIYYPVKSCRGVETRETNAEHMGLAHDRRLMVVNPDGDFVTQREYKKLALVAPALANNVLTLSAPNFDSIRFSVQTEGASISVNIWQSKNIPAIDQGDEAAQWFSDWLDAPVRLVRIADSFKRKLNPDYAINKDDHTGFADGYPILLVSEESLQDLNSKLDSDLPMNRFRPNMVVKDCAPFAEDSWKRVRVGEIEMALVKPCARCVVTTFDKETLAQSKEPLKTLNAYRKHELGAIFGMNVIPLDAGKIKLGMNVEVLN